MGGIGREQRGHAAGVANNSPVGCCLVRGFQRLGMSTKKDVTDPSVWGFLSSKRAKAGYHHGDGSLPFALRGQVRFVRTWSTPYMAALGAIAAYVRTGRACTPLARCNTLDFVPKSVCQGAAPLWNPCGAGTHVRRKMAKFHYIGGVLSLESMVYSAWPSKSEFEELIDWTNQNFIKNLVH